MKDDTFVMELHTDILGLILGNLDVWNVCRLSRVCKRWHSLISVLSERLAKKLLEGQGLKTQPDGGWLSFFKEGGTTPYLKITSYQAVVLCSLGYDEERIPWVTPFDIFQIDSNRIPRRSDMFIPILEEKPTEKLMLRFNDTEISFNTVPILCRSFIYDASLPADHYTQEDVKKGVTTSVVYVPVHHNTKKVVIIPIMSVQFVELSAFYKGIHIKKAIGFYTKVPIRTELATREKIKLDSNLYLSGGCMFRFDDGDSVLRGEWYEADYLRHIVKSNYHGELHPLFTPVDNSFVTSHGEVESGAYTSSTISLITLN